MVLTLFLTCAIGLGLSTLLLILLGHRLRIASRVLGALAAVAVTVASGELAGLVWRLPSSDVWLAEAALLVACLVVILVRPRWNPVGQLFFGALAAASLTYLGFAAWYTVAGGLSPLGMLASGLLLALELMALT